MKISREVSHKLNTFELRLSDCAYGCKIYGCTCGSEHVWHSAVYGCPDGKRLAGLPTVRV